MTDKRVCTTCGVPKAKKDYHPSRWETGKKTCRSCANTRMAARYASIAADPASYEARRAAWKKTNFSRRDRSADYYLRKKYGIGLREYETLLAAQNGLCKICEEPPCKKRLDVDHNHKTGKIRGLLCNNCNRAVGHLRDSPALCRKAAEYLSNE